jgi:hypothetical protein
MANNQSGVSLGLRITPTDIQKVEQQLDNLIKKYSGKKISLGLDTFNQATSSAKTFSVNIDASQKKLIQMNNQLQQLKNTLAKIGSSSENSVLFKRKSDLLSDYQRLNSELKDIDVTSEKWINGNYPQQVKNLQANLKVASNEMGNFTTKILAGAKSFLQWYAIGNIIAGIKRSIVSGIQSIADLDIAMVELRKVTDETESTYKEFYLTSNDTAKALGVEIVAPLYREVWERSFYVQMST